MNFRGPISLAPSRLARNLLLGVGPGGCLLLLLAALLAHDPWPLLPLPAVVLLSLFAARSWDRVRGLDFRPASLCLDLGDGRWHPVYPCTEARVSRLALSIALRRVDDGARIRLNVWRDAVDDATFRRLARIVRHGRWPRSAGITATASAAWRGHRA
ncbi:MAG: hypothetical protein EA417_11420 [Gammaproteobacteria bacterium]|nr:MAG: hypothetical protein EA417_11420 [Gammaproteobacteria bacterium]